LCEGQVWRHSKQHLHKEEEKKPRVRHHQNGHILEARSVQQKKNPTTKDVETDLRPHRAAAVQLQRTYRLFGRQWQPGTEIFECGERPKHRQMLDRINKD
jgi:hypothetical protein